MSVDFKTENQKDFENQNSSDYYDNQLHIRTIFQQTQDFLSVKREFNRK